MTSSISRQQFYSLHNQLPQEGERKVRGHLDNVKRWYAKDGDDLIVYSRTRQSWHLVREPSSRDVTPSPP